MVEVNDGTTEFPDINWLISRQNPKGHAHLSVKNVFLGFK